MCRLQNLCPFDHNPGYIVGTSHQLVGEKIQELIADFT